MNQNISVGPALRVQQECCTRGGSANVISLSLSVLLHCIRTVTVSVTLHLLNNEQSEESRSSLFTYFEYFTEYREIRVEVGIKLLLEGFA